MVKQVVPVATTPPSLQSFCTSIRCSPLWRILGDSTSQHIYGGLRIPEPTDKLEGSEAPRLPRMAQIACV